VNVLAYYSSAIFLQAQFSEKQALTASLGWGLINWLFAIPAIYTIDTFGRRNLLLTTFPLMAIFLLFTGFSFWIPDEKARLGCVALGMYLFGIVYSPGEGKQDFTPNEMLTVNSGLRSCPVHLFGRSVSTICPCLWHVVGDSNNLVLQLRAFNHVAFTSCGFQTTRSIRILRNLEYYWLVAHPTVLARDQRTDARRIGPGFQCLVTEACCIWLEADSVVLQEVYIPTGHRTRDTI
jgi:Sugar (and other) transporter